VSREQLKGMQMPPVKRDGLPKGVYRHGSKYRCRFRELPGTPQIWSTPFTDPYRCLEFRNAATAAVASGGPAPTLYGEIVVSSHMTAYEFAIGLWKQDYERRGNLGTTDQEAERLFKRHLRVAEWATEQPFSTVSGKQLDEWFAARVNAKENDKEPKLSHEQAARMLYFVGDFYRVAMREAAETGITVNKALEVTLPKMPGVERRIEHNRKQRLAQAHAVDIGQVAEISRGLHANDVLPMWLMFLCALRVGETFGLRIGDWDPAKRVLRVYQQYGVWTDRHGVRHYIKEWTKTVSGRRLLYVGPSLALAIDDYIARVHGDHPPTDALICVGTAGPSKIWARVAGFRHRLHRAIEKLGLQIDLDDGQGLEALDLTPHDFRRTIGGLLHATGRVDERGRSAYLGHRLHGGDGASVTGERYTPLMRASMRNIAAVVEDIIRQNNLPLTPVATPDLISAVDAAQYLGVSLRCIHEFVRRDVLTGARHNPYARPPVVSRLWVRRSEVEALRQGVVPSPDVAVPSMVAAKVLGICQAEVYRHSAHPDSELDRYSALTGVGPLHVWITAESIQRWIASEERIAAGDLVPTRVGAAQTGLPAGSFASRAHAVAKDLGLPPRRHRKSVYWDIRVCRAILSRDEPPSSIEVGHAARQLRLNKADFRTLLDREGLPTRALGRDWISLELFSRLRVVVDAQRRQASELRAATRKRGLAATVRVYDPPNDKLWTTLFDASKSLHLSWQLADRALADAGADRQSFRGVTYIRRSAVVQMASRRDMSKYLTMAQAARRLGVTTDALSAMAARGELQPILFPDLHARMKWVLASDIATVRERRMPAPTVATVSIEEAQSELGVSEELLRKLIWRGVLTSSSPPNGYLWRLRVRLDRTEVTKLKELSNLPDGYLTVDEVASRTGYTTTAIYSAIHDGRLAGIQDPISGRWRLPPTATSVLHRSAPAGFLTVGELVQEAAVAASPAVVALMARRGELTGAIRVGRRSWRFPPASVVELRKIWLTRVERAK